MRELLAAQGDGHESLFEEMLGTITIGEYGEESERELMASTYNIVIRVHDAFANRWIVNQEANPKSNRVIAIL